MKQKNCLQKLFTFRNAGLLLILAPLILGCAPSLRVSSDYDRSIDFSTYRTFRIETTTIGMTNPLNEGRIVNSIQLEMKKKGFLETGEKPDLMVHAVVVLKNKDAFSVNTNFQGHGGVYRPYGFWAAPSTAHATVRKDDYKEGTLVINFTDSKTGKIVWIGTVSAEVTHKPKNPDKKIRDVVEKVMADFPSRLMVNQSVSDKITSQGNAN